MLVYSKVNEKDAVRIVGSIGKGRIYRNKLLCRIDRWDFLTSKVEFGQGYEELPHWDEIPFFKGQQKVVLRHAGLIDPEEILDYIAVGGYNALARVLSTVEPAEVVNEVMESKLRGRGGAGFPTGVKWGIMQKQESGQKYLICNADEGDPGAYMNRNEIESDPHMLIEGMLIGAYAMGADSGIAYVRAEYPLAVKRLKKAIRQAGELGLLGENILGSGLNFRMDVVEGAGAFVCGEETALIASIEGKAGRPMPRPPYPASRGLYGKPTNINNVETCATCRSSWRKGVHGSSHRDGKKCRHQSLLAGRQGEKYRAGGASAWLQAGAVRICYWRRNGHFQAGESGTDRRPFGRLYTVGVFFYAGRLRIAEWHRSDHGVGRYGGDGSGQLHGGCGPLLSRIQCRGVVWQMHPLP